MADDHHKPSGTQCLRDIHIVRGRRTWHSGTKHGGKAKSGYHGGSKDVHGNSPFW